MLLRIVHCLKICSFKTLPVSETNEKGASIDVMSTVLLLSCCLSTSQVKMKEQLGYSEN